MAGTFQWSLRWERAESSRLAWAFTISLALHLLIWGGYHTGKKLGVWEHLHWPAWMQSVRMLTEVLKKKDAPPPLPQEPPLMFVDVSSAQSSANAPPNAKFYSDKNSKAANPEADKDTDVPRITGQQTQVAKTEDVPREKFVPLQPSRPAQPAQEEQLAIKAKPTQAPGDLTMAKPDLKPRPDEGDAPHERPRKLQEARARMRDNSPPGEKMKQEGGLRRNLGITSVDAKATPFGAYDAALIEAIRERWYSLLYDRDYASDGRGKVVLQFHLHYDGTITDMNISDSTVNEVLGLICERAVLDPAPFEAWPSDMRRMLGNTRNIQFTFYYN
jgi:outer membrane biosynthesis protein TonB